MSIKTEPNTVAAEQQFKDVHEKGAKRYGSMWLQANSSATDLLSLLGISPHLHKLLGSAIALKLCIWRQMGFHEGQMEKELNCEEHF